MATDTPDRSAIKTLLLSDLVDSTTMTEELGDRRAAELFAQHDRLARDLIARFDGHEIDKSDGFLILFDRPVYAVDFALAFHEGLARISEDLEVQLRARIGIHQGEVILRDNLPQDVARGAKPLEVEGISKPTAARLMSLAKGRQTLLTRSAFDQARRDAAASASAGRDLRWLAHGPYQFKGVVESVEVFEVGIEGLSALTAPRSSTKAGRAVRHEDELTLGWRPAAGLEIPRRPGWIVRRKLGEGGFGEVWLVEHEPSATRRAFKFCYQAERLRGLQREVTLFRLLRETLGDRKGIAQVIDWNLEEQPYYLETDLAEHGSLEEWCAAQGGISAVPLASRLELLAQVAEALAAAHSVGVLHKDVKPSNVLITSSADGRPQAQLTDFGIGLILDHKSLLAQGITVLGMTRLPVDASSSTSGTWMYMAPELVEGKPATIQADIYALGVMLYQLVAGDFSHMLAPGWQRDVADDVLAEDIKAAVDGSPSRRLANAALLAERLRTLEQRRAAQEAERNARQRAERSRRQRRTMVVALIILAIFGVVVSGMALRVAREAERAEREAKAAQQVADFLVGMFEVTDPYSPASTGVRGRTVTARDVLDYGARRLETELVAQPEIRASLMNTVGRVYMRLGQHSAAKELFQQALALRRECLGDDHADVAESLHELAGLLHHIGELDAAEELLSEALLLRRRILGEEHRLVADSMHDLAWVLQSKGELDAAERCARDALAMKRRCVGENRAVAASLNHLAFLLQIKGDLEAAESFAREALAMNRRLGSEHPDVAESLNGLARVLLAKGDPEGAEPLAREGLEMRHRLLGEEHVSVAQSHHDLAVVLRALHEFDASEGLFLEALVLYRHLLGDDDPAVAMTLRNLVELYQAWDRPEKVSEYEGWLARVAKPS